MTDNRDAETEGAVTAELRGWPKPGTRCEFAGCGQRAYALVADVDRAIYICRECYDRRERER